MKKIDKFPSLSEELSFNLSNLIDDLRRPIFEGTVMLISFFILEKEVVVLMLFTFLN